MIVWLRRGRKGKYVAFGLLLLVTACSAIYLADEMIHAPSHEREWQLHYQYEADAREVGDVVVLDRVRNWNHDAQGVIHEEWLDTVVIDPQEISQIWFGLARFSDGQLTGHSFLSFELPDGSAYTLSIEARREIGEEYSAWRGLFNTYELWYGWGTERDFLGVSLFLLNRPLELYPLRLSATQREAVFRAMAAATAQVAATPRFYNTLSANCTNLLARAINRVSPAAVPYDLAWNLPGLTPEFLFDEGLLDVPAGDFSTVRQQFMLTQPTPALWDTIDQDVTQFSQILRSELRTQ